MNVEERGGVLWCEEGGWCTENVVSGRRGGVLWCEGGEGCTVNVEERGSVMV